MVNIFNICPVDYCLLSYLFSYRAGFCWLDTALDQILGVASAPEALLGAVFTPSVFGGKDIVGIGARRGESGGIFFFFFLGGGWIS